MNRETWEAAYIASAMSSRYDFTERSAKRQAARAWLYWNTERGANEMLSPTDAFRSDAEEWA